MHADARVPKQLVFGPGLADPTEAVTNRRADPWPATIARTLPVCTYTRFMWTVLQVEFHALSRQNFRHLSVRVQIRCRWTCHHTGGVQRS